MYAHTTDHREQDGGLVNRSFWISDLPRPLLLCRAFGHRPVVDGYDSEHGGGSARWVACDRCGVRPCPQGRLDPALWNLGQKYRGPFDGLRPWEKAKAALARTRDDAPQYTAPGAWPKKPTWTFGGQIVAGIQGACPSIQVKVGNAGSEHTLAAHLSLGRLGGLYLHTEYLGTWLQRRLNPTGYESRIIRLAAHDGRLHWKLWTPRDSWSATTPRWRDGSVRYNPADTLWGERRSSFEQIGDPVPATLRLPHGDDHRVELQLERVTTGRPRGRHTRCWSVDWDCPAGIPTRRGGGGRTFSSSVRLPDTTHDDDDVWVADALAAIAVQITRFRRHDGYLPPTEPDRTPVAPAVLAALDQAQQAAAQAMDHLTAYVTHGDPAHLNRAGQAQERTLHGLAQITRTETRR